MARHQFHAELKGIFGSVARGNHKKASDLDILVDFGSEADLLDWVGLAQFLEEKLCRPVDLVPLRSLRPEIKKQILAEAIYL